FLLFHSLLFTPSLFFSFTDPATTEIYTLSLHDALPISVKNACPSINALTLDSTNFFNILILSFNGALPFKQFFCSARLIFNLSPDRKSTRLNSSHVKISYAVFCLKKKKKKKL